MTRRRDVDGLRALAILGVITFHAAPEALPGGFAGVDVFFVISGYLIGGILLRGTRAGTFTFRDFYARRIRRIVPALVLMVALMWLLSWAVLLPQEFVHLGRHLIASATFSSNMLLWQEAGYFDIESRDKPLLHLWSLGIEEQFYLLWPVLIFALRRHQAWLVAVMTVIVAISVVGYTFVATHHESAAFYLLATRLWEPAVGSLLAAIQLHGNSPQTFKGCYITSDRRHLARTVIPDVLVLLGLALIVTSYVSARTSVGLGAQWYVVLAPSGALLVLAFAPRTWCGERLLGNAAIVYIGLISYSLYLWHWPLLSLLMTVSGTKLSLLLAALTTAIALVIAAITYRYVELPLRATKNRRGVTAGLCVGLGIQGLVGYWTSSQTVSPRYARPDVSRILAATTEDWLMDVKLESTKPADVIFSAGDQAHRVLFIGDSVVQHYWPRVRRLIREHPSSARGAIFFTHYGCPPTLINVSSDQACLEHMHESLRFALDPSIDAVVIAADWRSEFQQNADYYFGSATGPRRAALTTPTEAALDTLEDIVRAFVRKGKAVFIVLQLPYGDRVDPNKMITRRRYGLDIQIAIRQWERDELVSISRPVVSRLREIAKRTGAYVLDPLDDLCDERKCRAVTGDGEPVFRDSAHLRASFVERNICFLDRVVLRAERSGCQSKIAARTGRRP